MGIKRKAAYLCILVMLVCIFQSAQVFASQSKSQNYSRNYSLTGNGADDIVAVAQAQMGKTKAQLGYSEAWCADFVSDCAQLAGQGSKVPFDGYCQTLYNKVINAGGQVVQSPKKGDLVFYYCSKCSVHWCHVGIMKNGTQSIEGNYGGKVSLVNGSYRDGNGHSLAAGTITRKYVRPNYTVSSAPAPDSPSPSPKLHIWISDSKMGSVPGKYKNGETYYLCYELLDGNTGKLLSQSSKNGSYTVTETIYNPNGSVANSCSYTNDNNWIACTASEGGKYKGKVSISGDYNGSLEISYDVPVVSSVSLKVWLSDTKMGREVEEKNLKKGQRYYFCYELVDKNTGKRLGEVAKRNYTVKETICKPGDNTGESFSYENSDNNWLSFLADKTGTYKGIISISGDLGGTLNQYWNFKASTKKITYNVNGGSPSISSQTAEQGSSVKLSFSKPIKSYTVTYNANGGSVSQSKSTVTAALAGWYKKADLTGEVYQPGNSFALSDNITLYASYQTAKLGTLPTPVRSGYKFNGWYTSSGAKAYAGMAITANTTLTARWIQNTYNVNVVGGTGSGQYAEGTRVTVKANAASDGMKFKNWIVVNGNIAIGNNQNSTCTFKMPANSITVKAVYEAVPENKPNSGSTESTVSASTDFDSTESMVSASTDSVENTETETASDANEQLPSVEDIPDDENSTEIDEEDEWEDTVDIPIGTVFTKGIYKYKVISDTDVSFLGLTNKSSRTVTIPDCVIYEEQEFDVVSIVRGALKKTSVEKVTIGNNIEVIGDSAFEGCKSLKSVVLGNSVKKIGSKCFKNCKQLKTIKIESVQLKKVGKEALKGINSTAKIRVLSRKYAAYKKLLKGKGQGKKVKIQKI